MVEPPATIPTFLDGGGECGALIAAIDWGKTAVGPIETWSASLRSLVANLLHTRQPMLLFWGPDLVQFYNDAFVPSFGLGKHPTAMGQRARACWAEVWPIVGGQIEAVMARGEPAWHEDALVPIFRNGKMEEVFWTYSYSPAFDDAGRVYGTLVVVTEMTGRVVAARRLAALSRLSVSLSAAATRAAVLDALVEVVAAEPADVPLLLVADDQRTTVRSHGMSADLAGRVGKALSAIGPIAELSEVPLPAGVSGPVWPEDVGAAAAVALGARAVALFGLSPRLPFDAAYRTYLAQLAEQVTSALRRIESAAASVAVQQQRDDLLMHAPVATALLTGPEHVHRLANPHYVALVGREVVGRPLLEALPELRGTPVARIFDDVYASGRPAVMNEEPVTVVAAGAGDLRHFNFNLEPVRDADDRVYGLMIVAVDVTEQVRARQVLEKTAAEGGRVMAALEEASRVKDEFLAMLGHELRNPLAPMLSALELMDRQEPPSRERAVIARQLKHVVRLVDDLLDISKVTRGVITLERRVLDLADALQAAIETTAPLVAQRGHAFRVVAARGVHVDGDEARLVQIFSNLLTNAARYTPPGGEIHLRLDDIGGEAVVSVRDTGAGIAENLLPRLFEPFVQGVRSVDRPDGGLGLGLAIVQNLVTLHGGQVSVESGGAGKGSTFTVRLPKAQGAVSAPRAPRAVAVAETGGRKRLLVVDDNEDAANLLGELARACGHEVTVVHDAPAALEVLGDLEPEVAVLDIGLPGMNGYELAERMRALVPRCRLIALSGYGQAKDRQNAISAGFSAHLVKPVSVEKLLALL